MADTAKVLPREVQTSNVAKEIKKYSIENSIHPAKVDFDIVNVTTEYCEIQNGNEQIQDWHILDGGMLEKLKDKSFILNPNIRFRQKYELRLKKKDENSDLMLDLSFGENKSMTKLAILIKKESKIKMCRDLAEKIMQEIEKEKLKHGYFIRVWNTELQSGVSTLVINFSEDGKLTKDYQINIGGCEGGSKPINDKMIYHYKTKKEARADINYIGVKEQELLLEYIKPQAGFAGRNCKGEYIPAMEATVTQAPKFNIGDGIEVKEDNETIKYYAKKNGVITFNSNTYNVVTDISFAMLNFRETSSIKAGLDSGVKLSIEEKDPLKDAVGAGVDIEVTELTIKGNLGRDTKIKVNKLKVEGQVHTSSNIYAKEAEIGRHKGFIEGEKIIIDKLESGKIIAEEARITTAMGGEIRAKRVYINNLVSNCTVYAKESIVINNMKGDNNKLHITSAGDYEIYKEYMRIKNSFEEFEKQLRYTGKTIEDYKEKIKEDKLKAKELKEKLLEYKQKNIKPPTTMVNDFHKMKELIQENRELEEKIIDRENALMTLKSADDCLYKGEVMINNGWEGHSSVIFDYLSADEHLELRPRDGVMKVTLQKADENDIDSIDEIIEA